MLALRTVAVVGVLNLVACAAFAAPLPAGSAEAKQEAARLDKLPALSPAASGHIDHSGRAEKGKASFYAPSFANHKMADGRRMNPNSNVAASKTLPLGSVASVMNLKNGKTASVRIEDRGPYVKGRVVDLAPKVAEQLGVTNKGVVPVEVKPITLPHPDGGVRLGAGAAGASPREIRKAVEVTKELTQQRGAESAAR